jgi:hypothetical protein
MMNFIMHMVEGSWIASERLWNRDCVRIHHELRNKLGVLLKRSETERYIMVVAGHTGR